VPFAFPGNITTPHRCRDMETDYSLSFTVPITRMLPLAFETLMADASRASDYIVIIVQLVSSVFTQMYVFHELGLSIRYSFLPAYSISCHFSYPVQYPKKMCVICNHSNFPRLFLLQFLSHLQIPSTTSYWTGFTLVFAFLAILRFTSLGFVIWLLVCFCMLTQHLDHYLTRQVNAADKKPDRRNPPAASIRRKTPATDNC